MFSDYENRLNVRKSCNHPKWTTQTIEDPLQGISKFDLPKLFSGPCTQGALVKDAFKNDVPHVMERCLKCGESRTRKTK